MLAFDDSPCWIGEWTPPDPATAIWVQSAVARTVRALPELHPLRLGDTKGTSGRVVAWCGRGQGAEASSGGLGLLTQLSPPPDLDDSGVDDQGLDEAAPMWGGVADLATILATTLPRAVADAVADSMAPERDEGAPLLAATTREYVSPAPGVHRWGGALARIDGAWLPPVAVLPVAGRGLDDPATSWSTESVDFAAHRSVHCDDVRVAADLLAPHVMAMLLDRVPYEAAVSISGDALHIWWDYDGAARFDQARVARVAAAATELVEALPSFVLADHPDHSDEVEQRLRSRAADAAAYRAARDAKLAARRAST